MRHARPLIAALATLSACSTNPATGERQLILISQSQEIAMGRQYDPQIIQTFGLVEDDALQRYVQDLGAGIAATSEQPQLPWTFRVVDDPVVNAFALPGGFIYVSRGILAHFDNEAQLAAVLGHEIGHVTARHSAEQMSTQQLAQIGLVAGMLIEPDLQRFGGLAVAGLQVLFLKHSRDDERQADDLGLRYMQRARFDPREMPDVFTMLERVSQARGGDGPPEWLSTHPNPGNRRERIEQAIAAGGPIPSAWAVNRDGYLQRLQGMVYGDNPREGFFRDARFFHPDLRFQLDFPAGWKTSNQRDAVLAVSQGQDALMQVTLAEGETPDLAARQFFAQEGVTGRHIPRRINDLPAEIGTFRAATPDRALDGAVAFIGHGANVYRVLGYSASANWPRYEPIVQRTLGSFRELTDPAALNVQPMRLEIVRLDRPTPVTQLAARSSVTADILALLNQTTADATLPAGNLVKLVAGGRMP